ncbi:hypothetical protein FRC19_001913 [Serendipita sp. 401]|nr:hypothetical protein FRC19_001913 [Serendipita sp. 401]
MLDSIPLSFDECKEILRRDIKLDPGFADFHAWCKSVDIPVVIVSSGMSPWIRAVLSNLIGEEEAAKMEIISNDVAYDENGRWHIRYRHPESGFGHDKSYAILPYRALDPPPVTFFFGDGVSGERSSRHLHKNMDRVPFFPTHIHIITPHETRNLLHTSLRISTSTFSLLFFSFFFPISLRTLGWCGGNEDGRVEVEGFISS